MRKTILVVEDDTDLRDALLDVLKSAGFDVLTAADDREALEILKDLREPALMLLEKIPAAGGFEVRRQLLETPGVSEGPVMLLSRSKIRSQRQPSGSARSPKKRFCKEDLLRIVTQYCEA